MGTRDGSIIATIITDHIVRNDSPARSELCPGIHVIDMVQPPGISMPPIADMDLHHKIVVVVLAAKSSAETPKNVCCEVRSHVIIVSSPGCCVDYCFAASAYSS
jgi:hypothetical protein